MCSIDFNIWLNFFSHIYYIITNGLAFSVTICPNLESVNVFTVGFYILDNLYTCFYRYFFHRNLEERLHLCCLPAFAIIREFESHDMTENRSHSQCARLPIHMIFELEYRIILGFSCELRNKQLALGTKV